MHLPPSVQNPSTWPGVQETPVTKPTLKPTTEMTQTSSIIASWVAGMSCDFRHIPMTTDKELADAAHTLIHQHVSSEQHAQRLIAKLPIGAGVATRAYSTCPWDVRVLITILISMYGYIDDADPAEITPQFKNFAVNFGGGVRQTTEPVLDYLAHLLTTEVPKFWGPFATSCIIKGTLDLVAGWILENHSPAGFEHLASGFPGYLRNKTGGSELCALAMFPECVFPESEFLGLYVHSIGGVIEITDAINDIVSYYKETVVGREENGRIAMEASLRGCHPVEVLEETCKRAAVVHAHLKYKLGKADQRVLETYCLYVNGLTAFHILSPRYKLKDLGIGIEEGRFVSSLEG